MTTVIRAGILPASTLRAMASKFEPRPESRMPRFFIAEPRSPKLETLAGARGSLLNGADAAGGCLALLASHSRLWHVLNFRPSRHDAADDPMPLTLLLESIGYGFNVALRHHQQQAKAHVEGAQHFVLWDAAEPGDQLEDRQHRPGAQANFRPAVARQNARSVVSNSAPGDVDDSLQTVCGEQGFEHRPVAPVGREQFVA